jgi:hypothetical protein
MRVARRLVGVVAAVVLHHSLVSSRLESVEVGPTGAAEDACTDGDPSCEAWAEEGECFTNPGWMLVNCRKSCGKCGRVRVATGVRKQARGTSPMAHGNNDNGNGDGNGGGGCVDKHEKCLSWAEAGECQKNPGFMLADCLQACNVCPARGDTMTSAMARSDCVNSHEECEAWAKGGECSANPSYMITNCARACRTCHLLDAAVRCRPMPGRTPALQAHGHLNETFERASDPNGPFADLKPRVLSRDPWVVVFDAFTSPEEVAALIARGGQQGFSESVDAGKRLANGSFAAIKSSARTSETAWCTDPFCVEDPLVSAVTRRIADVSRVPYENSEYLQVLRYYPGQYYVDHHDYIPGHLEMPCGPRLYTLFLYLSDVEEGGGTAFNRLKGTNTETGAEEVPLVVQPAVGRAVLWPSVRDGDPFKKDPRTNHEAKPVISGTKFAANAWIHMYDFKAPFKVGCTG